MTKELISIGSNTPLDNSFLLYPAIRTAFLGVMFNLL